MYLDFKVYNCESCNGPVKWNCEIERSPTIYGSEIENLFNFKPVSFHVWFICRKCWRTYEFEFDKEKQEPLNFTLTERQTK